MAVQSIKFLVVIPWTIKYTTFFINNNLKDRHCRENNELYFFIANMLKPPTTLQVHEMIFNHLPFYVDVKKNYIEKLTNDEAQQLLDLKAKIKKNVIKNLLILMREQKNAMNENVPKFQGFVERMVNQSMTSETNYMNRHAIDQETEIQKRKRSSKGKIIDNL